LVAVSALTLVLVLGGLSLAVAGNYAFSADSALRGNNLEQGLKDLKRARQFNPFNSEYDAMLARIYQAQQQGEKAVKTASAAVVKSKYNAARHAELASAYQSTGDFEKAVLQARKAVSLAPFQIHWYENLSRTCFVSGYMMLNDEQPEKAKPFFEQATGVPKEISDRMAGVTPKERELWVVAPLMDVTPSIAINTGGALCFLGRFNEANERLTAALETIEKDGIGDQEKEMYSECCLWLAFAADKQGDGALKQEYLEKGMSAVPELEDWYKHVAELPVIQ
jgi:tetratricopeptide (TPR) repeat protein